MPSMYCAICNKELIMDDKQYEILTNAKKVTVTCGDRCALESIIRDKAKKEQLNVRIQSKTKRGLLSYLQILFGKRND